MRRRAWLCVGLVATVASAESLPSDTTVVKPKVLVIVDTSKSMIERPDGTNVHPWTPDGPDAGVDFDCRYASNQPCKNKFCTAKQVLCETMTSRLSGDPTNGFTSQASVGLATYFQYVNNVSRPSTSGSSCDYDILENSGKTRRFTTTRELTGGGSAYCGAVGAAAGSTFSCTGSKSVDLSGAGLPLEGKCSGDTNYTVTKTSVTAGGEAADGCRIYNYATTPSFPLSWTAINGCSASATYSGVSSVTSIPIHYRVAVGASCPSSDTIRTFDAMNLPTPATTSWSRTSDIPASPNCSDSTTNFSVGCFSTTAGSTIKAGTGTKAAHLFLQNKQNVGSAAAYAFFNNAATVIPSGAVPATTTATSTSLPWNTASNYGASPSTLTFTAMSPAAATCSIAGTTLSIGQTARVTNNASLSSFGFANVVSAAQTDGTIGLSANQVDKTISISGSTYNCTPGWPCDITLVSRGAAGYAQTSTVGWKDPACTGAVCTPLTLGGGAPYCQYGTVSRSGSYRTVKSGATCPNIGPFSATPTAVSVPGLLTAAEGGGDDWSALSCGSGEAQCEMFKGTSTTISVPVGECPSPTLYDGTTALGSSTMCKPGSPWRGVAIYQRADNTAYQLGKVTYSPTALGASSPAAVSFASASAATTAGYEYRVDTMSPWQAMNTLPGIGSGSIASAGSGSCTDAAKFYVTTSSSATPSGTGWAAVGGAGSIVNRGGVTVGAELPSAPLAGSSFIDRAPPDLNATAAALDCEAYTGLTGLSAGQTSDTGFATYLGGSGAYRFVGKVATGTSTCGAEGTKPCYTCRFEPIGYVYRRYVQTCTWPLTQSTFTAKGDVCPYRLNSYPKETCQATCNYETSARKYDFNANQFKLCEYRLVSRELKTQTYNFTYEYQTRGGELFGVVNKPVPGVTSYCASTGGLAYDGTDSSLRDACPKSIPNCEGLTGVTCRLRYGSSRTEDRYKNYAADPTFTTSGSFRYFSGNDPSAVSQAECRSSLSSDISVIPSDPSDSALESKRAAFCNSTGTGYAERWILTSDWYQPASSTTRDAMQSSYFSGGSDGWTALRWTKSNTGTATVTKDRGGSVTTPTASMPGELFVPIPSDATSASSQDDALKDALRKCVLPGNSALDPTRGGADSGSPNWVKTQTGLCMAEEGDRQAPGWSSNTDFTPLYGSLINARDYLAQEIDADSEFACRDYYIVLATDGQENTPANYTSGDLINLVQSMKDYNTPGGRTKTIKSFVIGFGTDAGLDTATLDAMQAQGNVGLTQAFNATDLDTLRTALNSVFSAITQGVYSRSKPTIATDGQRIYAGAYTKFQNTPEWKGDLYAYKIDQFTGGLSQMWSFARKLDDPGHGSRNLTTATDHTAASQIPFSTGSLSNSAFVSSLTAGFPDAGAVVNFVANPTFDAPFNGGLTQRKSRVGPIVRSSPVVVGRSPYDRAWGGSVGAEQDAFQAFTASTATREARVLVGTNDGMLRGIREATGGVDCNASDNLPATLDGVNDDGAMTCANGKEAWGFVPSDVLSSLYQTMSGGGHFNVDGLTSVGDVCWTGTNANCTSASDWKTIAIGSMRGGGRALFALDVTASDGGSPAYLWGYSHPELGKTYSSPALGRIRSGSADVFVAIFGAGKATGSANGDKIFMLNAVTGAPVGGDHMSPYDPYDLPPAADVLARPAVHRIPNQQYLFASYAPSDDGVVYVNRFTAGLNDDSPTTVPSAWAPTSLFSPHRAAAGTNVLGTTTTLTRVAVIDGGVEYAPDSGLTSIPPTFALVPPSSMPDYDVTYQRDTMPFNRLTHPKQIKALLNRPKIFPVLDASGRLPDLFLGSGDVDSAATDATYKFNYFLAIHDTNARGADDGKVMWGHYFVNPREQVVSEPALTNGCLVVATYTPAAGVSVNDCGAAGDTTLYGFDPVSGALKNCLVYAAGAFVNQKTSVIHMGGVGIPSDLLTVGNNLYFATSNGGIQRQSVVSAPSNIGVRSFRRVR